MSLMSTITKKPRKDGPRKSSDPNQASVLAEDAEAIRKFTERVSSVFPSLKEAASCLGVAGGERLDVSAFVEVLERKLHYQSEDALRIYHLIDERKAGSVSEFEIAQLFTGPKLLRTLERQLKGKVATLFVAFSRIQGGGTGDVSRLQFRRFLVEALGYTSNALIDNLFAFIDADGDEAISFEEFRTFWNGGYGTPQGWFVSPMSPKGVASPDSSPKSPGEVCGAWSRRGSVSSKSSEEPQREEPQREEPQRVVNMSQRECQGSRRGSVNEPHRSPRSGRRSQRSETRKTAVSASAAPKSGCSVRSPGRRRASCIVLEAQ